MSRIFDALQRSENERSGVDTAALPQGPELLKRAERAAIASLNATATHTEPEEVSTAATEMRAERGAPPISWPDLSSLNEAEGVPAMEHPDVLSRFPSLECSIPPQSRLVFLTDRESPAAEAIRLLGVRLRDMRQNRPLKKLLITSTIPQEGKSMISANLACALADGSDARVLLLEGDLRRPSLMQMFGLKKQPGICEWLQNDNGTAANICHLRNAGIWILSAGSTSSNLNEHLQPQRLETKMNEVAQWFDWIIIDSSPTLPLADTSVWMRLADGILLVTRQGTTEKQQLMKGLDALEQEKVIGAIVNGSKAAAYSGYYYRSSITSE